MEWVHVSDLVDERHLDPVFVPRVLAYVEARTVYETLGRVLEILYVARSRGLVDEKLVDIIADWLSEAETEYRVRTELVDPWFREAKRRAENLAKQAEKQAGSRDSEDA